MPNVPDQPRANKSLVRRALSRSRRAAGSALRTGVVKVRDRAFDAGGPLVSQFGERVGDLVDAASTRLLESDEAASQLAFFVESIAAEVDREAVLALVLKRNLLLDGTVLGLISPVLSGERELGIDSDKLESAVGTLATLLHELACLRDDAPPPPAGLLAFQHLEALADRAPDLPTDALAPYLKLELADEEIGTFVLTSYSLFLQTFLLRSTVQMAAKLATPLLPETT